MEHRFRLLPILDVLPLYLFPSLMSRSPRYRSTLSPRPPGWRKQKRAKAKARRQAIKRSRQMA